MQTIAFIFSISFRIDPWYLIIDLNDGQLLNISIVATQSIQKYNGGTKPP